MATERLYSIVVPTKNRVLTATTLVREILTHLPDDCELIVHDCGEDGPLRGALQPWLGDARLRYFHTNEKLSMTENFNRGLEKCRGEYVSILGDDDAVCSDISRVVRWMSASGIQAAIGTVNWSYYYWPDYHSPELAGSYTMHVHTGAVERWSCPEEVDRSLENFCRVRDQPVLACLYQGIVQRAVLERAREASGAYLRALSPDVYASYRLSLLVSEVVRVDYPLFTPGVCGASNAAQTPLGNTDRHIKEFTEIRWPDVIPVGKARPTYQAESIVNALEDSGRPDLIAKIDLPNLYMLGMWHDRASQRENLVRYFRVMSSRGTPHRKSAILLARAFASRVAERALRGKNARSNQHEQVAPVHARFRGVKDIGELLRKQEEALGQQRPTLPWS
jgi:hypothetical protein